MASAMLRQSSNSGAQFTTSPCKRPSLIRIGPQGDSTVTCSRSRMRRCSWRMRTPRVVVSVSRMRESASASAGGASTVKTMPGTAFLHLHRNAEGIQGSGDEQLLLNVGKKLGIHVVEIGFEDSDGIAIPIPMFAPKSSAKCGRSSSTADLWTDSPRDQPDNVGGAGEVTGSGAVAGGGKA